MAARLALFYQGGCHSLPLAPADVEPAVRLANEILRAGSGVVGAARLSSGYLWLRADGVIAAHVEADGEDLARLDEALAALAPALEVPEALRQTATVGGAPAAEVPAWWPPVERA